MRKTQTAQPVTPPPPPKFDAKKYIKPNLP